MGLTTEPQQTRIADDDQRYRPRSTSMQAQRRQKVKAKRQIILAIWCVAFGYLSLTATQVDSVAANEVAADRNDVYPDHEALTRSLNLDQGNVVIFKLALYSLSHYYCYSFTTTSPFFNQQSFKHSAFTSFYAFFLPFRPIPLLFFLWRI